MAIDPARKAVYQAFSAVVTGGAYADQAARRSFTSLDAQQSRFARRLLNETLDRIYSIDYALKDFVDSPRTLDTVFNILRLGACQILYMNSVPDRAAVDSSVELAKDAGLARQAGMINAVLRNVSRRGVDYPLPDKTIQLDEYLSARYSWPLWIAQMWINEWGAEKAEALMAWRTEHFITLRPNALRGLDAAGLAEVLDAQNIEYSRGQLVDEAFSTKGASDLVGSDLFTSGKAAIQGEGSQLVASVAASAAGKGSFILDACAAPGGKTAAIAARLQGDCRMTAWDIHPHRLELTQKTLARLGVENVKVEQHDASLPGPDKYDFILLDAPCSGLGVAWSNPDIKIQRRQREMHALIQLQSQLLRNTSRMLKPGGKLLYSTCTLSKGENEQNIRKFLLENKDYEAVPLQEYLPPTVKASGHMLQLFPPVHNTEGFFMALMRRIK